MDRELEKAKTIKDKAIKIFQLVATRANIEKLKKFKSPMYYWHTNRRVTAAMSMATTGSISLLLFLYAAGGLSIFGILLALFADVAALVIALGILIFYPTIAGLFGSKILTILVLPTIFSFILSRYITYVFAKKNGHL